MYNWDKFNNKGFLMSLFNLLLSSKKTFYTLDIGSRFIKVAEFNISEDQLTLTQFHIEECPPQALDRGNITEHKALSQALLSFFSKKVKLPSKYNLILSIGGSSVITGALNIPKSKHQDIRDENIKLEASQYLPVDLTEVYYIHLNLPQCESESEDVESIFLIAIKKEALSNFNLSMRGASLKSSADYPSVLALGNNFVMNHKNEIKPTKYAIILDIGFRNISFCVMRGEHLVFSRELFIGIENYVIEIQNELGVSYKEAQSLLDTACKSDSVPEPVIHAVQNYNSLCCKEISVGIDYFLNYSPQVDFSGIYVTGGGKNIPQLKSKISQHLNLPVHNLQTLRSVKTKGFKKQRIKELQPFLGVSVGLAQTKLIKNK